MNDFMGDTFDNFIFTQQNGHVEPNNKIVPILDCNATNNLNNGNNLKEVSFDDSMFLSKSSSDYEASHKILTKTDLPDKTCELIKKQEYVSLKRKTITTQRDSIMRINPSNFSEFNKENHCQINNVDHNFTFNQVQSQLNIDTICKLSSWGLPASVLHKYESKHLISMFPWQVECLKNTEALTNSKNLVYSAPTSAGKTLIAEILAVKTIFERQKKVIFILPFISIVREKMYYFQDLLGSSGIRVEGFMGSYNPPGGFGSVQIAICTIEKANNIINRLLEEKNISEVGAILVDEMHLLGDPSRGYLLELLLTKLRYISQKDNLKIQIIGMSATLPNLYTLAQWLNADLYTTNYRPVPLHENVIVCGEIYNKNFTLIKKLSPLPELGTDTDNILQLCLETIKDSCSVLIFCPTKNWCENLALQISSAFFKIGNSQSELGELLRTQLNTNLIMELLEQLKFCPVGLDEVLRKTTSFGVAFHHAGLTMDERDIIESAFRNSVLRILVATSTLSSGVNLPARRVIVRTPNFHGKPIDTLVYKQMIGRAGRMGKDSMGESFLICQKNDYKTAKELISAELSPVESCLAGAGKLKRAILEVIASGVASSPSDVDVFTKCTLLAAENCHDENLINPIEDAVTFLKDNEFIRLQKQEDGTDKYIATSLGKACLSSSIAPEEGLALFTELEKARQCFVLETELHLIYLVTPYSACYSWGNIDWMFYLDLWEKLPAAMKKVGELVGIRESYIVNATRGKIQSNTNKLYQKLLVHKRFFVSLALQDLVNEKPLSWVCAKFNCNRGMLQSLQQSASTFAGMVTSFSRQLGWSSVELLVSQFQDRLLFGVSRDLLGLMHLPILNGKMARTLYSAGIETIAQLANCTIPEIENILHRVVPFETEKEREGESEFNKKQRNKYRNVWITGKEGLTEREAAEMLVIEARKYVKLEMGLVDAKWESSLVEDGLNCSKDSAIVVKEECDHVKTMEEKQDFEKAEDISVTLSKKLDISDSSMNRYSTESTKIEDFEEESVTFSSKNIREREIVQCLDKRSNNLPGIISSESESEINGNLQKQQNIDWRKSTNENNFKIPNIANKNELSNIVNSPSVELNISDSSINSLLNNMNISLEKVQSDQSLFDESFSLQISDSERESVKDHNSDKKIVEDVASSSFLQNVFAETFNEEEKNISTNSEDILISSFEEKLDNKRKHSTEIKISNKKSKVDEIISELHLSENGINKSYITNKFDNGHDNSHSNFQKIEIVNVCEDVSIFNMFSKEVKQQKNISLSLACSKVEEVISVVGINQSIENIEENKNYFSNKTRKLCGFAITWGKNVSYFLSLIKPDYSDKIINLIKYLVKDKNICIKMFDAKEQIKVLKHCCDINFYSKIEDPKIADWILEPEGKEKNLQAMAVEYSPETIKLSRLICGCKGVGSVGLDLYSTSDFKIRSSVESVVTWHLTESLKFLLKETNPEYLKVYDTENYVTVCLAKIELNGMCVAEDLLKKLVTSLKSLESTVEKRAFSLAGRRFNFVSSYDVAKVIGLFKGKRVSTRKQILEQNKHPISDLVLQWRKINCTLIKMMYPLLRIIQNERIHGCYITHTSTGRISMHEPNLQNITKDFFVFNPLTKENINICCRNAFAVPDEYNLLSADYCQLELRILAHFSQDKLLCNILKKPGDVFKSIASKWNKVTEDEVTDSMRQSTKHLCYGIIYGIGSKALADQLGTNEQDAILFMETFRNTYPGIKKFINESIQKCRQYGFVETLTGRRRFLHHIKDSDIIKQGQAERQAVNTIVQGSAADIAKKAMIQVEHELQEIFHKTKNKPKLVLYLHDELIYEVPTKYLRKVAKILQKNMEQAVQLTVPFPVKLKTGKSWGELSEYTL